MIDFKGDGVASGIVHGAERTMGSGCDERGLVDCPEEISQRPSDHQATPVRPCAVRQDRMG